MKLSKGCRKRIERWVKALRSGEYPQGISSLCRWLPSEDNPDGEWQYCPMGVYYDVTVDGDWAVVNDGRPMHYDIELNDSLRKADRCLSEADEALVDEVVVRNDGWHWSFDRIADWLEEKYLTKKGAKA